MPPLTQINFEFAKAHEKEYWAAYRGLTALKIKDGRLVGLVSIGDLVKSIISDQEKRIEQFERYITGSYPT